MDALTVTSGHILALRLYDLSFAIDLGAAERLWIARTHRSAARSRLTVTPVKAMSFGVPPLALGLDPVKLTVEGQSLEASVTARLYEFGVISLALRFETQGCDIEAFARRMNALQASIGPGKATDPWAGILARLRDELRDALTRPIETVLEEDYLVGVVYGLDAAPTAEELFARVDFVPILSGESRALSQAARTDLLRQRFSYYEDDLALLTWDRAFVYEPRGDSDVVDVLEVANAQLLEMRYYDELLDRELPRMYQMVASTRRGIHVLGASRYARLARQLNALVAEVTELTEKVDNTLQVTEDVYLARIYASALDLFRVRTVNAAVEKKLAIIREIYTALYNEASNSRAALMEVTVIGLIVFEIVLAIFRR
jgi:hypothetical protein